MKHYIYRVTGKDTYSVTRVDEKETSPKKRFKEYVVNLKKREMCDCPATKKCRHVNFILNQLKDKGGVLEFQKTNEYDKLAEGVRRCEKNNY